MLDPLPADRLPRVFFLNACDTARVGGSQQNPELVQELVGDARVPVVVGMQFPIDDEVAQRFTGRFYQGLVEYGQADRAAALARWAVAKGEGVSDALNLDWGVPVVYLQAQNGFVFRRA